MSVFVSPILLPASVILTIWPEQTWTQQMWYSLRRNKRRWHTPIECPTLTEAATFQSAPQLVSRLLAFVPELTSPPCLILPLKTPRFTFSMDSACFSSMSVSSGAPHQPDQSSAPHFTLANSFQSLLAVICLTGSPTAGFYWGLWYPASICRPRSTAVCAEGSPECLLPSAIITVQPPDTCYNLFPSACPSSMSMSWARFRVVLPPIHNLHNSGGFAPTLPISSLVSVSFAGSQYQWSNTLISQNVSLSVELGIATLGETRLHFELCSSCF